MFKLGTKSNERLQGVHPTLQAITRRAIELSTVDFRVIEGLRTFERQQILFNAGKSKTMNSRHLQGYAVDVAALDRHGRISWEWPLYHAIADAFKQAAAEAKVAIEWGGDWATFKDGPHFQLPRSTYP